MASKKRFSHDDRVKMVVLRDEGYSLQEIATKLKCNRSTVCRTLAKQRACGTVDDRKRSGRTRLEMIVLCRGFAFTIEHLLVLI